MNKFPKVSSIFVKLSVLIQNKHTHKVIFVSLNIYRNIDWIKLIYIITSIFMLIYKSIKVGQARKLYDVPVPTTPQAQGSYAVGKYDR